MDEPRILVIDDEEVVLASLRKIFTRKGYHTDTFLTAREGLERLEQDGYDLVITDLMMPEVDGLEPLPAGGDVEVHKYGLVVEGFDLHGFDYGDLGLVGREVVDAASASVAWDVAVW